MYSVIIVEDHKIVAQGIKALLLGSQYKVIAMVSDLMALEDALNNNEIHIILLDIRLGGDSGIYIAKQIKKDNLSIKIIGLSSSTDDHTLAQCTKIGFDGFVSKSSSNDELLIAIATVLNHQSYFSSDIVAQIQNIKAEQDINPNLYKDKILTDRELEIVRLFAEGMSYKEIANTLNLSTSTVDTHKYKIFDKLGVSTTLDIVKYAIKNNLIDF
ncbi:MAG: response regulator transcription factor [Chitinophagales bacterium]|nr:response regulator transcription factor [Chitinophagales bacterium]